MSYWDTACLIKLHVAEPNSGVFRRHAEECGDVAVSAAFARLEFFVAVRRKEADGEIGHGFAERYVALLDDEIHAGTCRLISVDDAVRASFEDLVKLCYSQTPPIFVRTLDALHIATARVAGEDEIVATDKRLRDAATLLGFQLFPTPTP